MFSGAMALVLRMHGIPARVAVGFTTGRPPQKSGDPYIVTDRNAHAWVEVFFPGYGWMPFEPTPTRTLHRGVLVVERRRSATSTTGDGAEPPA